MPRLRLPARLDRLEEARAFVLDSARDLGLSGAVINKVELVLEEALVNVIRHAYDGGPGDVEIACSLTPGPKGGKRFLVEIRDTGPSFDPNQGPPPDLESSLEERRIGGLGIHLMRNMTDELVWERIEPHNVLRLGFDPAGPDDSELGGHHT